MKIKIDKNTLISGIFTSYRIADTGTNVNPFLSNMQIDALEDGTVTCKATDTSSSVFSSFKADVISSGKITVAAKLFYNLVHSMSEKEIEIEKVDNSVIIKSGKSIFELNSMNDNDFPSIFYPEDSDFKTFEAVVIRDIIDNTIFSVSTDETKPHITGIYLSCENNIATGVSTDGHRLSLAEYAYEGDFSLQGTIIPQKGAREIKKFAEIYKDEFKLAFLPEKKLFSVKSGSTIITVRVIDSKFPPYEQVIPSYDENKLIAPKDDVMQALKRLKIISTGNESGVILDIQKDKIIFSSTDTSKGKALEEIEVDYEGDYFKIAFNINFVEQILSQIDGKEFQMAFGGPKAATLLNPVDNTSFMAVLMPLKLND